MWFIYATHYINNTSNCRQLVMTYCPCKGRGCDLDQVNRQWNTETVLFFFSTEL